MHLLKVNSKKITEYSPGSPFIIEEKEVITAAEAERRINETCSILQKTNLRQNDHAAVLSENNSDFIITILALWKLKLIPVPINIRLTDKEIDELLPAAYCRLCLIHKKLNRKINSAPVISFPLKKSTAGSVNFNAAGIQLKKDALIIFTSGTTGRAKGVVLSFSNLLKSALTGSKIFKYSRKDKWLASLPFYHIGGFSVIFRALVSGIPIVLPASLSTVDLIRALENHHPAFASFVPTQLQRIIETGYKPGKHLRNVLIGGGFSDEELIKKALDNNWKISRVYGSSETSSFVAMADYKTLRKKPGTSGKALKPNKIFILDDQRNYVPVNKTGEIVISGPVIMKGYLNEKRSPQSRLRKGRFYSGDTGFLDNEGFLFVQARRSDLIVSGGENINPAEVENAIKKFPGIRDAAVAAAPDKLWGQSAAAFIVTENNMKIQPEEIRTFLKDKLAGYKIPRKFYFTRSLLKDEMGKINREKLIAAINDSDNFSVSS